MEGRDIASVRGPMHELRIQQVPTHMASRTPLEVGIGLAPSETHVLNVFLRPTQPPFSRGPSSPGFVAALHPSQDLPSFSSYLVPGQQHAAIERS